MLRKESMIVSVASWPPSGLTGMRTSAMSQYYNITTGIDLGDRHSHLCLLDTKAGKMLDESRIRTSSAVWRSP
jgi:hypothetical protein